MMAGESDSAEASTETTADSAPTSLGLSEGTVLPDIGGAAPEAGAPQEMRNIEFFNWFNNKVSPLLTQALVVGAVTAASFGGLPAALAAGAGMAVFELYRAHRHNMADLESELKLYRNDIAHVLGKSPDEKLTIQDMRDAANSAVVGERALKPLQMELEHLAYRGKYNLLMGGVRAAVTTTVAALMSSQVSSIGGTFGGVLKSEGLFAALQSVGSSTYFAIGAAFSGTNAITLAVEKFGKDYFREHKPPSAYKPLMQMKEASLHQEVQPEQVFDLVVRLDKDLAQELEERFGRPYEELTWRNKQRVMKGAESKAHAQALAEAINEGTLPATAVALSAFGQLDVPLPSPEKKQPKEPVPPVPSRVPEAVSAMFGAMADSLVMEVASLTQAQPQATALAR